VFFFQAEDGIRDRNVTGVQTCALPISALSVEILGGRMDHQVGAQLERQLQGRRAEAVVDGEQGSPVTGYLRQSRNIENLRQRVRSEERRVGKECRACRAT